MGDYDFSRLNPRDFEHLVQSLCKKTIGHGVTIFGDGRDGGREATFVGEANFPSSEERWSGYWVIQAKFRQRPDLTDNTQWVITQFNSEMEKFKAFKSSGGSIPQNYLFFTNVVTTPYPKSGGIDQLNELCEQYHWLIPNIHIFGYDDICRELDNNRDVAVSYTSFIMPGHILSKLYDFLKIFNQSQRNHTELLIRYLNKEFDDELYSKIEQGGNLTDDRVILENVFVDLYATPDGTRPSRTIPKFLSSTIELGNTLLIHEPKSSKGSNGRVLVAGAGYGKSTLTQFLCQTYRAFFLSNNETTPVRPHVQRFIETFRGSKITKPTCFRFPFRIILKDYAGWIVKRQTEGKSVSILAYMQHRIESKGDGSISLEDIRDLFSKLSFVFVFDGLDEVPVTSNRSEVITQIESFIETELSFSECDALIIATTRPQGYGREFAEQKYEHLQITNFDEDDCKEYLDKLLLNLEPSGDQRQHYLEILKKAMTDDVVVRLMQTPLQATIMTILVKSGGEPPRAKFNLFTEFYDTMFRRERQKDVVDVIKRNKEYIDEIHYKLGYTLQKQSEEASNPSSTMANGEFEKFVVDYLENTVGLEAEDVTNYSQQIIEAVKTRLVFISETEDGQIGFNVRSTQEFFAAQYLVHSRQDDDLNSILEAMAHSSYWRNTFLFAVGYINQFKHYAVTFVEALCSTLNGLALPYGTDSPEGLLKQGSWLALDLLNEDIFRAKPKTENKFIAFIEPLFTVVPEDGHQYFAKLPKSIINRTVVPLVEKYLKSERFLERRTALTIAMHLIRAGNSVFEELIDRLGFDDATYFFEHGYRLDMEHTDWYVSKLAAHVEKGHPLEFSEILCDENIIRKFVDLDLMTDSVKRACLITVFLQTLETPKKDGSLLATLLGIELVRTLLDNTKISVDVIDGYRRFDSSIFNGTNHLLDATYDELRRLGITWGVSLVDFLLRPSKSTLAQFVTNLLSVDSYTYVAIEEAVRNANWVLGRFFRQYCNQTDLNAGVSKLLRGDFGDVEEWKELEPQFSVTIDTFKNLSWRSFSQLEYSFDDFYHSVYLPLKQNAQSAEDEQILADEILFVLRKMYDKPIDNPDIVKELINCTRISSLSWSMMENWSFIIDSCTLSQLEVLLTSNSIPNIKFVYRARYLTMPLSGVSFTPLPQRIIDKAAWIITSHRGETELIKLLPMACLFAEDLKGKINYSNLLELKCKDPENEACRISLCMFNDQMKWSDYEKLIVPRLEWLVSTSLPAFKLLLYYEENRVDSPIFTDYAMRVFKIAAGNPNIQSDDAMDMAIYKIRLISTRQPANFPSVIKDKDWESFKLD